MSKFYEAVGGRKMAKGLLAVILFTVMAFFLDATYEFYVASVLGALGLTAGFMAWEDRAKHNNGG